MESIRVLVVAFFHIVLNKGYQISVTNVRIRCDVKINYTFLAYYSLKFKFWLLRLIKHIDEFLVKINFI